MASPADPNAPELIEPVGPDRPVPPESGLRSRLSYPAGLVLVAFVLAELLCIVLLVVAL